MATTRLSQPDWDCQLMCIPWALTYSQVSLLFIYASAKYASEHLLLQLTVVHGLSLFVVPFQMIKSSSAVDINSNDRYDPHHQEREGPWHCQLRRGFHLAMSLVDCRYYIGVQIMAM